MTKPLNRHSMALLLAASVGLSFACSNAGKGDGESGSSPSSNNSAQGADVLKPSRIVVTPKASWTELKGYIVGRADSSSLASIADQQGKVGFLNLSAGDYDIVLEANDKGSDGKFTKVALKISGIKLAESSDVQVRDVDLKAYLKVEGRVLLDGLDQGAEGNAGVTVTIPGTNYQAQTASDGTYSFPEIPEGHHNFSMVKSGFDAGYLLPKSYRANDLLPTIALSPDSNRLENGIHYLGPNKTKGSAQKISLQLRAPNPMNYFRYAVNGENLDSRPWIILQSSLEIDLPPGDKPEVKVQYSLDQRQLSPVYAVTIPVE